MDDAAEAARRCAETMYARDKVVQYARDKVVHDLAMDLVEIAPGRAPEFRGGGRSRDLRVSGGDPP
ncbi:hypothetical protein [Actinomadura sp. GTD37]|uniref:hypothetical protein n=1 Tax=Actinomadura sp. GTD37 TaxID=1778030 RepID=UPI0035BFE8C6